MTDPKELDLAMAVKKRDRKWLIRLVLNLTVEIKFIMQKTVNYQQDVPIPLNDDLEFNVKFDELD